MHEVRQFVGLASFFRKFVKNYAFIARPLTMLTKKDAIWHWGDEQNNAFHEIKSNLVSRPVLALYKRGAETELHTDASQLGLGGILMQRDENNQLHLIAYFSRQTTKEVQRYHSYGIRNTCRCE